ncbi:histidine kinase [Winogradskya consettensis]|uniref:histidine kinase n=1 Tax=Winogradskya consettensis TaxID=113560 RepID=A0A919VZK1_9ACTN|nr:histidine kinase [Actinoplanes consettensis]GIM82069.1 two-component sensor histidine kinase [Actinoplanes consettensis]
MTLPDTAPHRFPVRPFSGASRVLAVAGYTVIGLSAAVEFRTIAVAGYDIGALLSLASTVAAVVVLRRFRVASLLLFAAGPLAAGLLGHNPTALWSIAVFGAFLLALRGLPGLLIAAVTGAANLAAVGFYYGSVGVSTDPSASIAAFAALVAASAGSAVRTHQQYRDELEGRARAALESREAAVRQGLAEERVRIARDLHDSVGHQIAVVSMHLGAAEVRLAGDPQSAAADLGAARVAVQAVLLETQQILRVLRIGGDNAPPAPTPSHERIGDLVAGFRAAGMTVEAVLPDLTRPLAAHVSQAAYRIAQEALTNAQRHGTGAVSLRVAFLPEDTLTLEVVNVSAGSPGAGHHGGNGIVGMRERAQAAGGSLDARGDDNLFRVYARLPATR